MFNNFIHQLALIGALLTQIIPNVAAEPPGGTPDGAVLEIEAEDAILSGSFLVGEDLNASCGRYIHVPNGMNGPGSAEFVFHVAEAGGYAIEGGVYAANSKDDSFFVRVNGVPSYPFVWDVARNTTYGNDFVSARGQTSQVAVWLPIGTHTVSILLREDGTRLDRLRLVPIEGVPPPPTTTQDTPVSTAQLLVNLKALAVELPGETVDQRIKQAVIDVHLSRAEEAMLASLPEEAAALLFDIAAAIKKSPSEFSRPNPDPQHLAISGPLLTPNNNPYLDNMVASTTNLLASGDVAWPWGTVDTPLINSAREYYMRSVPAGALTFFWLFAHEQSPMWHDSELIPLFLNRAMAMVDCITLDTFNRPWRDQFAMEYTAPLLYQIAELYPCLILPSQKMRLDQAMENLWEQSAGLTLSEGRYPWNYNIESAKIIAALNAGLHLDKPNLIDGVVQHFEHAWRTMRQDGAQPYHGVDRPSVNYHNTYFTSLQQVYEQTRDETLLTMLKLSQWKTATMGWTEEFWTSPFDKAYRWNFRMGAESGPEIVHALTGNPFIRWRFDRNRDIGLGSGSSPFNVQWYMPGTATAPPENYTLPDRNVGGPRAWYGQFCYAGGFQSNGPGREGFHTLMGAMTVDEGNGRLNSILARAAPVVYVEDGEGGVAKGWLTYAEQPATTISSDYSVSTCVHDISRSSGPYKGPTTDWQGKQIWVGVEDRLFGLIAVAPTVDGTQAYNVQSVFRLISGGTAGAATLKDLEVVGPNHYRYGALDLLVHANTFSSVHDLEIPYRLRGLPATELTFSDRTTDPEVHETLTAYALGTEFYSLVEIRPSWRDDAGAASLSLLGDSDVRGLEVITADRAFQVWLNTTEDPKVCTPEPGRLPAGTRSFALSDGLLGAPNVVATVPDQLTLSGREHALVVVSANPADHQPSLASFDSAHSAGIAIGHNRNVGRVGVGNLEDLQFTITNPNNPTLHLTGAPVIKLEGDPSFTLIEVPASTEIPFLQSETFTIRYTPTSVGRHSALVRIPNNVQGLGDYVFRIRGTGGGAVQLKYGSPYGTSWERSEAWDDVLPASAGKSYYVSRKNGGGNTLRTPHNWSFATFPGDSLVIEHNGSMMVKGAQNGVVRIDDWTFNGGNLYSGSGAITFNFEGQTLNVIGAGLNLGATATAYTFDTFLTGDGTLNLSGENKARTFLKGDWGGDLTINGALGRFEFDIQNGRTLRLEGTLDLAGRNHTFTALKIGSQILPDGIYKAGDLDGLIGEGTLTIGPGETANGTPWTWLAANAPGLTGYGLEMVDRFDVDQDGFDTWAEYVFGTNPFDPSSVMKLKVAALPNDLLELRFPSISGRNYCIEYTDNLSASWQPAFENLPGTDAERVEEMVNDPTAPHRFFRIGVERP